MGYISILTWFLQFATQPHLNKSVFWVKDSLDMIIIFNLFKRFLKNIQPIFSSKKNTGYYLESDF